MKAKIITKGIIAIVVTLLFAGINYLTMPAWNISSIGMWLLILGGLCTYLFFYTMTRFILDEETDIFDHILLGITAFVGIAFLIMQLASSAMFQSENLYKIAESKKTTITVEDIEETNFDNLITVDKDTAILIGNRKMGTMTDLVSQYVVSDLYTQINYQNDAYRVSPLEHASIFKWSDNRTIPGYILVNVTDGTAEFVESEIRYSTSNYFGTNVNRMVRNRFPSVLFDNDPAFEIDEEGNPYWVYSVKKITAGLFGGEDFDGIILVNASNGDMERYTAANVPEWVDHAVNGDLVITQLDWNGKYKNGFGNSLFTQKDCTTTTQGYGYILGDNDIYLYTGITSVVTDESNIGFALVNMRTSEIKYIEYPSAEEYSAMSTAEGKIQEKGYKASFPVLIRKNNKLWYFLTLKDSAGLVKAYSFVDASDYTKVTVEDNINTAWTKISTTTSVDIIDTEIKTEKAVIENIQSVVIDGNSIYYIMFEDNPKIYTANITISSTLPFLEPGDEIEYMASDSMIILIK